MNLVLSDRSIATLKRSYSLEFKKFYKYLDRAHGVGHFTEVFHTGRHINNTLPVKERFKEELIFMVAFTHDIYTRIDRENHQTLSGRYVRETKSKLFNWLTPEEREMVALACEQHRASYRGEYSNLFCEVMACADRERPKSVQVILERAMLYREDHYPHESKKQIHAESVNHLKEKFGNKGYARYPELYEIAFKKELQSIRDEIDRL